MQKWALVMWFSVLVFLSLAPLSILIHHVVDSCLKWQRRIWYIGVERWLWTKPSMVLKQPQLQLMWQFSPRMNVTFDKWMLLHLLLSSKSRAPPPVFDAQRGLFFRIARILKLMQLRVLLSFLFDLLTQAHGYTHESIQQIRSIYLCNWTQV